MAESLKGKAQVDMERHEITCPHCRKRFKIRVRVFQTIQRKIVNQVVDLVTDALTKELGPKAKALAGRLRKKLGG